MASSTMNWQSLTAGDVDSDIESWTDNVVTYEQDKAEGKVIDVGVWVSDSASASIEPLASALVSVRDLKKYTRYFLTMRLLVVRLRDTRYDEAGF